jgi:CheY-like chemotaxis protein
MDSEEGHADGHLASPRIGTTRAGAGARPSGSGKSTTTRSRLPRILIVDDEPMIGTTLRVLLSDEHDVVLAESGKAAREHLEREGFDLILCDLMMPGLSGMELHRWLETSNPLLAQRMVFMTGGVFTDEARDFLDTVPNRRIEKPFDTRHLLTLIDQELARER